MTTADSSLKLFAFLAFHNWSTYLGNICKYAIAGLVSKHVSTHEIGATQENRKEQQQQTKRIGFVWCKIKSTRDRTFQPMVENCWKSKYESR